MPEIPEMETYRKFLHSNVIGKTILQVRVERERSLNVSQIILQQALLGKSVQAVERWGKFIVLKFSTEVNLLAHMMLDGRIYLEIPDAPAQLPGKPHVVFFLEDGSILHFCDLRLGYIKLLNDQELKAVTSTLGLDPLSPQYSFDTFTKAIRGKKGMIKPLLLDQKILAGIGNAYSNESLFMSGILPDRKLPTITTEERYRLFEAISAVLKDAIAKGGYIEEPFAIWDNLSGGFIPYFKVYDKTGDPCSACGTPIDQKAVGGRNSYYCRNCQH